MSELRLKGLNLNLSYELRLKGLAFFDRQQKIFVFVLNSSPLISGPAKCPIPTTEAQYVKIFSLVCYVFIIKQVYHVMNKYVS